MCCEQFREIFTALFDGFLCTKGVRGKPQRFRGLHNGCQTKERGETMKLRHLFFACSGVFVIMFSLLLLVVIVFSDEEDGGSSGNLIYGGVSVSQEVLAHKPMLEKYAREFGGSPRDSEDCITSSSVPPDST